MKPGDILKMNYPPIVLIYGAAGAGKTALVSQLSGAYAFDFDKGFRTAATLKDRFFEARQKIDFDNYKDPNPLKPVKYHEAIKKLKVIVDACAKRTWDHDAVVVDSLTGLCEMAQLFVQGLGDKSNPMMDPLAKMEIQNFGSLVAEVNRFLMLLQALQVPVIMTAHVDYIEEKVAKGALGETEITSMFPSSATTKHGKKKLASHFDEVWYADMQQAGQGKINYRVTGKPGRIVMARTRSSFDTVVHNDVGMVGLLKMIGYDYPGRISSETPRVITP